MLLKDIQGKSFHFGTQLLVTLIFPKEKLFQRSSVFTICYIFIFSEWENLCVCIRFSAEITRPETNYVISFIYQKINSFLTDYYLLQEENI